jgi:hypothetical protein
MKENMNEMIALEKLDSRVCFTFDFVPLLVQATDPLVRSSSYTLSGPIAKLTPTLAGDILQFLFVNGAFQPNPEEVIADLFKVPTYAHRRCTVPLYFRHLAGPSSGMSMSGHSPPSVRCSVSTTAASW